MIDNKQKKFLQNDDLIKSIFDMLTRSNACFVYTGIGLLLFFNRAVFGEDALSIFYGILGLLIAVTGYLLLALTFAHGVVKVTDNEAFRDSKFKVGMIVLFISLITYGTMIAYGSWIYTQKIQFNKVTPHSEQSKIGTKS